jgi:hypothetical protein
MATALPAQPEWGHPLITPEGRIIRVPADTFPQLRRLGLLVNNKPRLSPKVYEFLDPQYDCLALGLRQLLGSDLAGPAWLVCDCDECMGKGTYRDATLASRVVDEVKARRKKNGLGS